MSTKDKLVERFKTRPKDFTWDELVRLFGIFGFVIYERGKTSGSRVAFTKGKEDVMVIHKPHLSKIIKESSMKDVLNFLINKEYIKEED